MNQWQEFFEGLFDYQSWPPRWKCGYWSDVHGWLYIISELIIWTAYFLIPLIIVNYLYKRRSTIKFQRVYFLFASFILLCGSTHFLDALMFWIPMYRFNAVVRLATGIVSLATVYHLVKILPTVFKQKTNVELEKEISLRKAAEHKLAESNRSLQSFAYIASHDLQEPLRKISTFTNMLYKSHEHNWDEQSKQYADKVVSASSRMKALIDDVLTLSTLSEEAELDSVSLNEPIKEALEDLELNIKEKDAQLTIGNLPEVNGNSGYLKQLFYNLINNALKFSSNTPQVSITAEERGDKIAISIADNGIGIPEEYREKIFQPFTRLHGKNTFAGTGIGLAICKKIVEIHKGTIEVSSNGAGGTTFTILLEKRSN